MAGSSDKFYIMAMAATGKSTFTNQYSHYLGYRVVDFGEELPERRLSTRILLYISRFFPPLRRMIRNRPDMKDRFRHAYFDQAFDYINSHEGPIAMLGRRTRENYRELVAEHDKVRFSMVMIPEDEHRKHCESRKKSMKNPIPYFHHWTTDFDKILRIRREMYAYAEEFDIPVYEDIESAIKAMHRQYGGDDSSN